MRAKFVITEMKPNISKPNSHGPIIYVFQSIFLLIISTRVIYSPNSHGPIPAEAFGNGLLFT